MSRSRCVLLALLLLFSGGGRLLTRDCCSSGGVGLAAFFGNRPRRPLPGLRRRLRRLLPPHALKVDLVGDELLERVGESVALRAHRGKARDVVHGGIEPADRMKSSYGK